MNLQLGIFIPVKEKVTTSCFLLYEVIFFCFPIEIAALVKLQLFARLDKGHK
jgi:hypothetical protein